jgi:hypothetical protein
VLYYLQIFRIISAVLNILNRSLPPTKCTLYNFTVTLLIEKLSSNSKSNAHNSYSFTCVLCTPCIMHDDLTRSEFVKRFSSVHEYSNLPSLKSASATYFIKRSIPLLNVETHYFAVSLAAFGIILHVTSTDVADKNKRAN